MTHDQMHDTLFASCVPMGQAMVWLEDGQTLKAEWFTLEQMLYLKGEYGDSLVKYHGFIYLEDRLIAPEVRPEVF